MSLQWLLCFAYHAPKYDLCAVLVHTGLPGRKQIYSYVRDQHDLWWKTVDYTVTEVLDPLPYSCHQPSGLTSYTRFQRRLFYRIQQVCT